MNKLKKKSETKHGIILLLYGCMDLTINNLAKQYKNVS